MGGNSNGGVNYFKTLKYSAHMVSYEDLIQNERFLNEKGIDVSLSNQDGYTKVLRMPHDKLLENFDIICTYGICDGKRIDFPISLLACVANLSEKLDTFVETGLLGNSEKQGEEHGNYIKYHGGSINHISSRLYPVLYKMRRDMDIKRLL
ncbi:MAG: hypothetical protein L6V81_03655 [Clostridium sp.]|nr:MAG: hypothetical protein L6V81_03655 [Clostridium sp.]